MAIWWKELTHFRESIKVGKLVSNRTEWRLLILDSIWTFCGSYKLCFGLVLLTKWNEANNFYVLTLKIQHFFFRSRNRQFAQYSVLNLFFRHENKWKRKIQKMNIIKRKNAEITKFSRKYFSFRLSFDSSGEFVFVKNGLRPFFPKRCLKSWDSVEAF